MGMRNIVGAAGTRREKVRFPFVSLAVRQWNSSEGAGTDECVADR